MLYLQLSRQLSLMFTTKPVNYYNSPADSYRRIFELLTFDILQSGKPIE